MLSGESFDSTKNAIRPINVKKWPARPKFTTARAADTGQDVANTPAFQYFRVVANHHELSNFIWQIADLLRGPYRPPQYERVMLPMTVLRRFDAVLAPTKEKVLREFDRHRDKYQDDALDKLLNKAAGQRFHNHSPLTFEKLKGDPDNIDKHLAKEVGSGVLHEEAVALSRLIDLINDRFGTDFNQADQLFFDQIVEAAAKDSVLQQAAKVNPEDKFALVFNSMLETLFIEQMEQNEEVFGRYMNDPAFQKVINTWLADEVYRRLGGGESTTTYFKSRRTSKFL
jgi:type I restriction-modification system DNA methylase subunit